MTKVESELLTSFHRRWIETRDPKDGDRFALLVAELARKSSTMTRPLSNCDGGDK